MAVFRLSAHIIRRSAGRSATAAAAYRAGERIEDRRTGLSFDYRRRGGVEATEIITPDHAPTWTRDRAELWNHVEEFENRKDAQVAREIVLSLPHELTDEQRHELLTGYVRAQFVSKGMVADVAYHHPDREGDERNFHAHIMLTMRELKGDTFSPNKARDWNKTKQLEDWRREWADHQNRAFEKLGLDIRVDHRSLKDRGIDHEPAPKVGPIAMAMERRGVATDRGDELRAVQARNAARDELRREYVDLCAKLQIDPELGRAGEAAQVESRADPLRARALAREKMAERLRRQAAERQAEWSKAKEAIATKRKGTGKGSGGRTVSQEQTPAQRRAALAEHLRQQREKQREIGLSREIDGPG